VSAAVYQVLSRSQTLGFARPSGTSNCDEVACISACIFLNVILCLFFSNERVPTLLVWLVNQRSEPAAADVCSSLTKLISDNAFKQPRPFLARSMARFDSEAAIKDALNSLSPQDAWGDQASTSRMFADGVRSLTNVADASLELLLSYDIPRGQVGTLKREAGQAGSRGERRSNSLCVGVLLR